MPPSAPGGPPPEKSDDDARWLQSTALTDLHDPRLRLKVQSLIQLCRTPRDRAVALYAFVKRMPYFKPIKLQPRSARLVLDAGVGDAPDKAALLITMLRIAGIPARMHIYELRGSILRGFTTGMASVMRAVIEIRIDGEWVGTDTYIYDAPFVAAARERMAAKGWDFAYGMHLNGHQLWNGRGWAYLDGAAPQRDPMVLRDMGLFADEADLIASDAFAHSPLLRIARWDTLAPGINRVVRRLREQSARGRPISRGA